MVMYFSAPSLHPGIRLSPDHLPAIKQGLAGISGLQRTKPATSLPFPDTIGIPVTTVSLNTNFDAYINVGFVGASSRSTTQLLVDSGNSMLIVPRWEDIENIANWRNNYQTLGTSPEPWGCPANIVRGPIELTTSGGHAYTIPDCIFYACTGDNPDGSRTANFGAGCINPWTSSSWNNLSSLGVVLQSPLSYDASHPFVEFSYAPSAEIFSATPSPRVSTASSLCLHRRQPPGYNMLDIIPNLEWMALTAKGLGIGGVNTPWPGVAPSPIAMIDTGGGPVFLSDPNGYIYRKTWPDSVPNPPWTSTSSDCQSTKDSVTIELGEGTSVLTYTINSSALPPSAQGLTLVMCRINEYMRGQQGMNIGGISMLVNDILIDHNTSKVGLRPKAVNAALAVS
jgi:hypothetical protein